LVRPTPAMWLNGHWPVSESLDLVLMPDSLYGVCDACRRDEETVLANVTSIVGVE